MQISLLEEIEKWMEEDAMKKKQPMSRPTFVYGTNLFPELTYKHLAHACIAYHLTWSIEWSQLKKMSVCACAVFNCISHLLPDS